MSSLCLVVADQLFKNHPALELEADFLMVESGFLTSKFKYHKFKLAYILSSMREYGDFLKVQNKQVFYNFLGEGSDFEDNLKELFQNGDYDELVICEIADKYFAKFLGDVCKKLNIRLRFLPNDMFLTPKHEFLDFVKSKSGKRLMMNDFYIEQRKRLGILLELDNTPKGGKWSFDEENRQKLPKNVTVPERQTSFESKHYQEVLHVIEKHFPNNPGKSLDQSWLPLNHVQSEKYLDDFIERFFKDFGAFEDAMSTRSETLFHSCISALLNNGLLTPRQVLDKVLSVQNIPLNSLEGFIRQIIGWREWVKGLYDHVYDENFLELNHFEANVELPSYFYYPNATNLQESDQQCTKNLPLKYALEKVDRLAYCHHIERLMILANWMTLNGYKPDQCYTWFVEMFVDSSEWVMVANVMGMGLYADGGIFATKPYIAGGNYIKKMSDYPASKDTIWEKIWTDKFWDFLMSHQETFIKNPRMAMLIKGRLKKGDL